MRSNSAKELTSSGMGKSIKSSDQSLEVSTFATNNLRSDLPKNQLIALITVYKVSKKASMFNFEAVHSQYSKIT